MPDNTYIRAETTWKKADSPYLIKGFLYVQAPLTIEPGTVVKFEYQKGRMEIENKLTAVGTEKDKIIFTSSRDDSFDGDTNGDGGTTTPAKGDWLHINFGSSTASGEMRHVSILYGGGLNWADAALVINNNDDVSLERSEVKYSKSHGVMLIGAPPTTIEENIFSNNDYCGIYASIGGKTAVIRYNSIFGNKMCGAKVFQPEYGSPKDRLDARNNWWGNASGPQYRSNFGWPDNRSGTGDIISDGVLFDPWQGKNTNTGLDPVIVVPGIMGSWRVNGVWTIDPIFHTYDNLRDEFLANGYEDGKTFFTFPYEWRNSNVDNAKLLEKKIEEIKKDTGRPKVDIVAHSMGGLLAREYIESGYYAGDVDQLITVGTPQLGAPKDYVKWEAGESFFDILDMAAKRLLTLEALENGYFNTYDYIHGRPISSVQELLPTYNYLYDAEKGNALRESYPNNYPRNEFLEKLNNSSKIQSLKNTDFTEIIGKLNKETSTVASYNVTNSDKNDIWKHGYPKYFDIPALNRQGITKGIGDGTVTLISAEASAIPADKKIYFQSEHGALPTDAQKDILEILTGKRPVSEVKKWHIPSVLVALLHSPVDVQVISPSGEKIGKNFETGETYDEIDGAYYSGFDTNTEFLTIPNPEDGEYKILTEGTGTGEYTVETAKITQDETTGEAAETTATITGTAAPDVQEESKIKVDGDSVKKVEPLTLSPKNKSEETGVESAGIVLGAEQIQKSSKTAQDQILTIDSNDQKSKIQQLDDLKNSVLGYFKNGQIESRKEAATIVKNLGHIRVHLKNYEILGKKSKLSQKNILKAKKETNRHIDELSVHISRNFPKKINADARDDLIEKLNNLKL
ncbi:MAG: right-handed parallel beta-helix repeat-containing protein [Candidatus Moranbacteria bacterium]|nr:right-handed parallel beta-helix repeat-containing protein [Candidatus Moranbacteria bacterium]